jgi:hypothetical protein
MGHDSCNELALRESNGNKHYRRGALGRTWDTLSRDRRKKTARAKDIAIKAASAVAPAVKFIRVPGN